MKKIIRHLDRNVSTRTAVKSQKLSDERKNFIRLALLCFNYGTKAVKESFDFHIPPHRLTSELKSNKQALRDLYKKRIINQSQWDILFPKPPVSGPKPASSQFDVSLMINLLRSISSIPEPVKGWSPPPEDSDTSEAADLCRIRDYRNKIAHNKEGKINIMLFNTNWDKLKDAINRITNDNNKSDISNLKVISLDGSDRDDEVKWLYEQIEAYQKDLEELKSVVPEGVRDIHQRLVSGWKEEDKVFTETCASKTAYNSIRKNNVITVVGNSGMGKSAIAHHCAINLEKEGYIVYPVMKPADIIEYYNKNKRQVFVIDDPVGVHSLDQEMIFIWHKHENFLKPCLQTDTKILLTVRKLLANDPIFKTSKSLLCKNILDLQEEKYLLSKPEQLKMLKQHLKHNNVVISEELLKQLILSVKDHFPLLCRVFAANKYIQQQGRHFFQDYFHVLQCDIEALKTHNNLKYCALVLCAVYCNHLESKILDEFECSKDDREKIESFAKACGLDQKISLTTLKKSCDELLHNYLKLENDCYIFVHQLMCDAVLYHFGKDYPKQLLKFCSSSFVKEHIIIFDELEGDQYNSGDRKISLKEDLFSELAERLLVDIRKGKLYDVFMSPCMNTERFIQYFSAKLVDKGITYIIDLFKLQEYDTCENEPFIDQEMNRLVLNDEDVCERFKLIYMFEILHQRGITPLHWVVAQGMDILFKHILEQLNKDANVQSFILILDHILNDFKLLALACLSGNTSIFKMFTENINTNILRVTTYAEMLVEYACVGGSVQILKTLRSFHQNVNISSFSILLTICRGNIEMLKQLLIEPHADINKCTDNGIGPVFVAAQEGHVNVIKLLIKHHADINKCDNNDGSPVFIAAQFGHVNVIKLLIKHHADINKCDHIGGSPVYIAAQNGHINVLELLIKHHADINKCTNNGISPVNIAAQNGHINVIELLIKHQADINKCTKYDISPVCIAAYNGHVNVIELLIQHHADINKCAIDGSSPVFVAAQEGHVNVIELLIQHHADIKKCDNDGISPVCRAARSGHDNILDLLLQHHADICKCNNKGVSPVYVIKLLNTNKRNAIDSIGFN